MSEIVTGPGAVRTRRQPFLGALVYSTAGVYRPSVRAAIMSWNKYGRKVGAGQLFQLTDKPGMADVRVQNSVVDIAPAAGNAQYPHGPSVKPRSLEADPRTAVEQVRIDPDWADEPTKLIGQDWRAIRDETGKVDSYVAGNTLTAPVPATSKSYEARIIAHELGHTQGLQHSDKGLMQPKLQAGSKVHRSDARQVAANQGQQTKPKKPAKPAHERKVTGGHKVMQ